MHLSMRVVGIAAVGAGATGRPGRRGSRRAAAPSWASAILAWTVGLAAAPLAAQDATAGSRGAPWPTDGWSRATPAEVGLRPAPLASLERRIQAGDFGYVDHLFVTRHGRVVLDRPYDHDYREISRGRRSPIGCGWGCDDPGWDHQFNYFHPDWHPYHRGTELHTLQSVTKSMSATILAVAIERGEVDGVEQPLVPLLDDYDVSEVDPRLGSATLEDLLEMRTGIEWHETDRPMDDSNTTIRLERSPDWVRFTLDQPMDARPGERWVYNSGGSHLLSAILRRATGRTMDRYAEEHLFGPLGIGEYHWKITPAGLPDALGGLYLGAADLAKIGYLYLRDGVWDGRRILPDGWVEAATARRVDPPGYGYQWWRPDPGGVQVWAGQGFGGQYLLVVPSLDVVAVVYGWNLFAGRVPSVRDALVAALVEAVGLR